MNEARTASSLPVLRTRRLRIELARPQHATLHAEHFARNAEHLRRWDPPRGDVSSVDYWQRHLASALDEYGKGQSMRWVAFPLDAPDTLVARINYSQIVRGVFHSCMLGYALDADHGGRGLMTEALRATIDYMFAEQKLHRIQANHRPENERSARLLARLGFMREGYARQYLFIDGAWRDHVLHALINPDFDAGVIAAAAAGKPAR